MLQSRQVSQGALLPAQQCDGRSHALRGELGAWAEGQVQAARHLPRRRRHPHQGELPIKLAQNVTRPLGSQMTRGNKYFFLKVCCCLGIWDITLLSQSCFCICNTVTSLTATLRHMLHTLSAQPERRSFKARGSFKSSKKKSVSSPLKRWKLIAFGGKLTPDNRLHYAQVNYSRTLLLPIQVDGGCACAACFPLSPCLMSRPIDGYFSLPLYLDQFSDRNLE